MRHLVNLEFRRNFSVWLAVVAVFCLSFPAAALFSRYSHSGAGVLHATAVFWVVAGVLVAQACFGLTAGAGARAEENTAAEDILPVSPWKRSFSGLLVSLAYGMTFAALVFSGYRLAGGHASAEIASSWTRVMPVLSAYIVVLAYSCAYFFGSVPLGLLAMIPPIIITAAGMAAGTAALFMWQADPFSLSASLWCFALVSAAGFPYLLSIRAGNIVLSPRGALLRNTFAGLLLLAGPAVLLALSLLRVHAGANAFRPFIRYSHELGISEVPGAGSGYVFMTSIRGALAAVGENGEIRRLLEPAPWSVRSFSAVLGNAVEDLVALPGGGLLVLQTVYSGGREQEHRIWKFDSGWRRELLSSFRGRIPVRAFLYRDGEILLFNHSRELVAEIPAPGSEPQWKKFDSGMMADFLWKAGEIALHEGRRNLSYFFGGKKRSLTLPSAPCFQGKRKYAERIAGSNPPVFRVRLSGDNNVCGRFYNVMANEGGKAEIRPAADHMLSAATASPSYGEMVNWRTDSIEFIGSDGKLSPRLETLPPQVIALTEKMSIRRTFRFPLIKSGGLEYNTVYSADNFVLMKYSDGVAEALLNRVFLVSFRVSDGALLKWARLPLVHPSGGRFVFIVIPGRAGAFIHWGPRLYFVTWEGGVRQVDDWSGWYFMDKIRNPFRGTYEYSHKA